MYKRKTNINNTKDFFLFRLGFENENYQAFDEKTNENSNFDPSLIDLEPLLDSYDDTTLSNTLNDDYLNGFFNSQGRRLSNGTYIENAYDNC